MCTQSGIKLKGRLVKIMMSIGVTFPNRWLKAWEITRYHTLLGHCNDLHFIFPLTAPV